MAEISALIRSRLNGPADDPMILYHGERIARGWVRRFVDRLQDAIDALGLEPGAPIGLVAQNRPDFIAAMLALIERGQPIVMIYAYQSGEAIGRKIRELAPAAVIAAREQWPGAMIEAACEAGVAAIATDWHGPAIEVLMRRSSTTRQADRRAPDEAGIALLTSGTTGPPKHFAISYARLLGRMVFDNVTNTNVRRPMLLYFPIGNISGVYLLLPAIAEDNQVILLDKFNVPEWLGFVRLVQPAAANLPPAAFRMILDAGIEPSELACIQYVATGAATLDPTLRREFEARYDVAITQSYGATEFGGIVTAVTPEHIARFGREKSDSVGRPIGGAQLRIVDAETGRPLRAGEEGRIEVFTPTMADDWITTTDLGLIDEDGFLYHRGRLDGAIVRGGFKIIPEQVAEALMTHPAVAYAAVVGVPDARLGAVPVAAVQLRDDAAATATADLERHLRDRLPATMLPTRYAFVRALPRTPSLKIDVGAVRTLMLAEQPHGS